MSTGNSAIEEIKRILGERLLLLARTGTTKTGESPTAGQLIFMLRDGTTMQDEARALSAPLRQLQTAYTAPFFYAAQTALERHLQLDHLLQYQLAREGAVLVGKANLFAPLTRSLDPHAVFAEIAAQVTDASVALVPAILADAGSEAAARQQLTYWTRRTSTAVHPPTDPKVQFAHLQKYLDTILRTLPVTQKWSRLATGPEQPLLPGLQAIYTALDQTYLVFNTLSPDQIIRTDWRKLAQKVPAGCKGIHITTVAQFALQLLYARPTQLSLRKFRHSWGTDFLSALQPEPRQLLRHAARDASNILTRELPNFFFAGENQEDDFLHHLIHEFQNKLLNIRLEHELLSRFGVVEKFDLPGNLPGREAPADHRVTALQMRLDYWSRAYFDLT